MTSARVRQFRRLKIAIGLLLLAPTGVVIAGSTALRAEAALSNGTVVVPAGFRSDEMTTQGQRFHFVRGGTGEVVVLLHGWPQTWQEWTKVMPLLAAAGYDVIAIDMPGIGRSTNPRGDYSKAGSARDIAQLLSELKVRKAHIVGHDIGAQISFAYAAQWPARTSSLTYIDAPLPGTATYDRLRTDPRAWHFAFHGASQVAERLVAGREDYYINHSIRAIAGSPASPSSDEVAAYISAYRDPETLRTGFEWYRAFTLDATDNRRLMAKPLTMPVLALNGDRHTQGQPYTLEMFKPLATKLDGGVIANSGHWTPEEQPQALATRLIAHFKAAGR